MQAVAAGATIGGDQVALNINIFRLGNSFFTNNRRIQARGNAKVGIHGPVGIRGNHDQAFTGVAMLKIFMVKIGFDTGISEILKIKVPIIIVGYLAGIVRLATELLHSDYRVGGRTPGLFFYPGRFDFVNQISLAWKKL